MQGKRPREMVVGCHAAELRVSDTMGDTPGYGSPVSGVEMVSELRAQLRKHFLALGQNLRRQMGTNNGLG